MIDTSRIALVGVDWGTTNLRAFAMDGEGAVLARRADDRGAAGLSPDRFAAVLDKVAGDWRASGAPVLVCGMAGARGGWVEAPYAETPAALADLATHMIEAAPGVRIVPGVCERQDGRLIDVMRGEEVQALGALSDGVAVCPGTHSKWVRVAGGRIVDLRTVMTGELFAVLRAHSILGRSMSDGPFAPDAFDEGVDRGLADPAVTAALFSVRTAALDGRLAPGAAPDYLSGLLIGAEIGGARDGFEGAVHLIGAPALNDRYGRALARAGRASTPVDPETAVTRGLWLLWKATA
ncbi:MAG: 2-dehydro-3-deoxygalactonokinase [Brevundimonas sp.]